MRAYRTRSDPWRWLGIGTYAGTISELQKLGHSLDVIVYDPSEVQEDDGVTRFFGTEASWDPWSKDAQGCHTFPPMVRYVREDGVLREFPLGSYSAYTDLMRNCAAIISKPGSDPERLAGIRNPFCYAGTVRRP